MVRVLSYQNKKLYQCEECKLVYENKEIAEQCQVWCKEHKSCNLDLIKCAVSDVVSDTGDATIYE